jgi:hypothetical protein
MGIERSRLPRWLKLLGMGLVGLFALMSTLIVIAAIVASVTPAEPPPQTLASARPAIVSASPVRLSPAHKQEMNPSSTATKPDGNGNEAPPRCVIQIPRSPKMAVPALPTEAGLDEYSIAASEDASDRDMTLLLVANRGKVIDPGTRCSYIDVGLTRSHVKMVDGTFEGQKFWFPTEWTRGGK